MQVTPGTRLGPYEIVALLGTGGMGEVYRATDTRLRRPVAIKIVSSTLAGTPDARQRFEREARTISSLSHPHICALFDVGQQDGLEYLVMEYLEGETLAARLARGPLSIGEVVRCATAIAAALDAAHGHGIVHRDLKPANVFLCQRPDAPNDRPAIKLIDFGLAKTALVPIDAVSPVPIAGATQPAPLTSQGTLIGTFNYMAPERLEGADGDARSDLFALGAVIYEMCTGRKAFDGKSQAVVVASVLEREPVPMSTARPETPPVLDHVVARCLVKNPIRRWQAARDVLAELEWLEENTARVTPPPRRPGVRLIAGSVAASMVVAGVATTAVALAMYLTMRRPSAPPPPIEEPVLVMRFDNRSGDPGLESFGSVIADRLLQGLTAAGVPAIGSTGSPARSTIAGAFYARHGALEINARFEDTDTGRIRYAFEPIGGPRSSSDALLDRLKQNVVGAVAFAAFRYVGIDQVSHAPTYDAYREFATGLERFGSDYAVGIRHFERANSIDPAFIQSRLHLVSSYFNLGQHARAQEMLDRLTEARDRLTPYERLAVDYHDARLRGSRIDALAKAVAAHELDPDNMLAGYWVTSENLALNQPHAVLDVYRQLRTERFMRLGAAVWLFMNELSARHMIGDFDGELQRARQLRQLVPQSVDYRLAEARALIAAGRIGEAQRETEQALIVPGAGGRTLLVIAQELRAHGQRQASLVAANRAVTWYAGRASDSGTAEASRADLARALYAAERWQEARAIFEQDVRNAPEHVDDVGYLGTLAARRGDRIEAQRYADQLRAVNAPHLFGQHTFWRARIAACLHDAAHTVDLMRDAFSQGRPFGVDLHRDMDFESVQNDPTFRSIIDPNG
jgi:serine/threonine protein kinase/tetratricopeptide (TPR) repeat protein